MQKILIYILFFVLSFRVINDNTYYISRAASSIEESEKSDKDSKIEDESEKDSDLETNISSDEEESEDEKSEAERNERLASQSRYLTNKGTYMEIVLDVNDGDNITTQLQAAFVLAGMKATKKIPYKIIIPKGTYYLSSTLHIYSNTSLFIEDVVFVRYFQEGPMLMSGNYMEDSPYINQESNIVIQGGTFDGNCFDTLYRAVTTSFSNLYFAYAKDIQLIGVKVINNMDGHYIEMKGVDNIIIRDCIFDKYCTNKMMKRSDRKEALKFGTMELLSKEGEVIKELTCNNILIQNNRFKDVFQGIGFEYIPDSKVYRNVSIYNNIFSSCKREAMILSSLFQSSIYRNRIENAEVGIWIQSLDPVREVKKWDCKIWQNSSGKKDRGLDVKIYPMLVNPYIL